MQLPKLSRLRESTAVSTEAPLLRASANGTEDCPDCTGGTRPDGSTCATCGGKGAVRESEDLRTRVDGLERSLSAALGVLRESQSEALGSTFSAVNSATTKTGLKGYEVVLIKEGTGNSSDNRWYTKHGIQEMVASRVCEGMQAYSDHPSLEEEEILPERSIKDLVGSYHDVRLAESSGRAEARAIFVPVQGDGYEWVTTLAEAAVNNRTGKPLVGISLYGLAAGEEGTRPDGSYGPMADLIRPSSGDIVTNAGAGGEFVRRLVESARAKRRALRENQTKETPMTLAELQAKITETASKLREAGSDEERNTITGELEKLAGEKVEMTDGEKLDGLTVEKLAESAPGLVARIRESVKPVETTGPHGDDKTVEQLRGENEQLKGQLREANKTISDTSSAITGMKVLREAKVPTEDAEYYLAKFRESGAKDEAAMKSIVEREQAREATLVSRVRESAGLVGVEGNPGSQGSGEGLIVLDGVPRVEQEAVAA